MQARKGDKEMRGFRQHAKHNESVTVRALHRCTPRRGCLTNRISAAVSARVAGMTLRMITVLLAGLLLSACTRSMDDLEQKIAAEKQKHSGEVGEVPEVRPYETFIYSAENMRDPFALPEREDVGADEDLAGERPDKSRRREPLEVYSLDSLTMVGTFNNGEQLLGLIKDPDGLVHKVHKGNYVGQNYGHIEFVRENEISLVELVPDGMNGFMQRKASLTLEE